MATYSIELGPDHEDALTYWLEQHTRDAQGADPPMTLPTRAQLVAQATRAGLAGPYSSVQGDAELLVRLFEGMAQEARDAAVAQIASAALRAWVTRRLAAAGG